jgi:hypothetical protein
MRGVKGSYRMVSGGGGRIARMAVRARNHAAGPSDRFSSQRLPGDPARERPGQVEEGVVNADRQSDEQDHRADHLIDVQQVAQQLGQADRAEHRGDPRQQRTPAATSAPGAS